MTSTETGPKTAAPSPTANDQTSTTRPGATSLSDQPPDSTLSYKDQTVTGTLGSYCWGSVCTDMAGIPVPPKKDTLTIPAGSTLVFDFGGEGSYEVTAAAYPLNTESETLPGPDGVRYLAPGEDGPIPAPKELKAVQTNGRTQITGALPPGQHILSVFLDPGRGDASYFYRLRVDPANG